MIRHPYERFKKINFNALPKSYKEYLKPIFDKKQDDTLLIVRHFGYEFWLWDINLPIEIASCR